MFDRLGIYQRYASLFTADGMSEFARQLQVTRQTVFLWANGRSQVPWNRLKSAVDSHGLSWDWMIDGKQPKYSGRETTAVSRPFDTAGINRRFLELYPGLSNAKLGQVFGLSAMSVFRWRHNLCQVPWDKLKQAADVHGVTWEWLLAGQRGESGETAEE